MSSPQPSIPRGLQAEHPERAELASLGNDELVRRFAVGVENFDRRALALSDAQLDMAFLPEAGIGQWPCRVLLGHLADAEMLFVHRMRRIVAEENPVLAVWDEEAFIDAGIYGTPDTGPRHPIGAFIGVMHSLRRWTAEWLAAQPFEAWDRMAMHPERGTQSLRVVVEYDTWHMEHHAWYLNRKVTRFLGSE